MDRDRYDKVVMPHRAYLIRYANILENDPALREDLVQETMCLAAEKLDGLAEDGAVKGWLRTIMKHACVDSYRKNDESTTLVSLDNLDENSMSPDMQENFHTPEGSDNLVAMYELIDTMSDEDQQVLLFSAMYGHTSEEIGEMLNIPHETAKKRLTRAKARLKELANV